MHYFLIAELILFLQQLFCIKSFSKMPIQCQKNSSHILLLHQFQYRFKSAGF
jgi:hypothetical protein